MTAELSLWYDRTCVGPRKTFRPCDDRGFTLEAHSILTPRWFSEREVEFGPLAFMTEIAPFGEPGWAVLDVTELVAAWHDGDVANSGLVLKLPDDEEACYLAGPSLPSSTYGDPSVRPRLTIWWSRG